MPRKAKPTKHTAKELARKQKIRDDLRVRKSGVSSKQLRDGRNPVKKKFECPVCHLFIPDAKTMEIHWDSKHSKLPFVLENCEVKPETDKSDEKQSSSLNNSYNNSNNSSKSKGKGKSKSKSQNNNNNGNNSSQSQSQPKSKGKGKGKGKSKSKQTK